eukprot:symbB.v1.2.010198.t1/scaffold621.1/size179687/4
MNRGVPKSCCEMCGSGIRRFLIRRQILPIEAGFSEACRGFIAWLQKQGIKVVVFDMDLTMGGGHCGEGILKEHAGEYIARASPDFVEVTTGRHG